MQEYRSGGEMVRPPPPVHLLYTGQDTPVHNAQVSIGNFQFAVASESELKTRYAGKSDAAELECQRCV